jgi:DNA-binding LacI/PurR family transcriptional regulator
MADVPIHETQSDAKTVGAALEVIFASVDPPTAILAQSDKIALLALEWLKARSIAVPGQVSVIGFDGVPESAESDPPLTTMKQSIREIGRRAVKIIVEGKPARETVAVELVVRGSTAPPQR